MGRDKQFIFNDFLWEKCNRGDNNNVTYVCNSMTNYLEDNLLKSQSVYMTLDGGFWKTIGGKEHGGVYRINLFNTPFENSMCKIYTDSSNIIIDIVNNITEDEEIKIFGKANVIKGLSDFIGCELSTGIRGTATIKRYVRDTYFSESHRRMAENLQRIYDEKRRNENK